MLAVIGLLDVLPAGLVLINVNPIVGDTLLAKELLGLLAIGAPRGTVDRYFCVGHLLSSKATEIRLRNTCTQFYRYDAKNQTFVTPQCRPRWHRPSIG